MTERDAKMMLDLANKLRLEIRDIYGVHLGCGFIPADEEANAAIVNALNAAAAPVAGRADPVAWTVPAERQEVREAVIEECAKWHESEAKSAAHQVAAFHRFSARELRALAQFHEGTGGREMTDTAQTMLELAAQIEQRHGNDHNGNRAYLLTRQDRDLIVAALRSPAIGTPDDAWEALEFCRDFKITDSDGKEVFEDSLHEIRKAAAFALALSALAAIPREQDVKPVTWRSMETAPKNGTRIILSWGGTSVTGYYLDNSKTTHPWQGWKVPSMENWPKGQPNSWQPFPAPHSDSPGSGRTSESGLDDDGEPLSGFQWGDDQLSEID